MMNLALALLSSALLVARQEDPERVLPAAPDERPVTTRIVFAGRVLESGGRPARGAVVSTSAGGEAIVAADGSFELAVDVVLGAESVELTAFAEGRRGHEDELARTTVAPGSSLVDIGALVLAPAADCAPRWVSSFGGTSGADAGVVVLAAVDLGAGPRLVAGGAFTSLCGTKATHVAEWDGSRWSALGSGVSFDSLTSVEALAVFDDGSGLSLYVGGHFTSVGGAAASCIARWNGSTWSALASGLDDDVLALAVFDDGGGPALYAGGTFGHAGGVVASNIARWDGASWSAVGGGTLAGVDALAVFDDGHGPALYAGGSFSSAGATQVNRIARWDGTSWSALAGGVNGTVVKALAVFDDGHGPALFAGGNFSSAGGVPASHVARWDGTSWSGLGSGVDSRVEELKVLDLGGGTALYAGGWFTAAGGALAPRIARWDGVSWSAPSSGPTSIVFALEAFDEGRGARLFAGGDFATAGDATASRIARFDGSQWSALARGLAGPVTGLAVLDGASRDSLYAAVANTGGPQPRVKVCQREGSRWRVLGNQIENIGAPLLSFDDGNGPVLLACELANSNQVVRWDGTSWLSLGAPVSGHILALASFDDGNGTALYAAGDFELAGGTSARRIARLDGATWSPLGSGLSGGADSKAAALVVFDDGSGPKLYAGGTFSNAGGVLARRIARWDGTSWSAFGPTLFGGAISALAVLDDGHGPTLYAAGDFTNAGGVVLGGIARWDGTSWSALGSGMDSDVLALAAFDDGTGPAIFAGGAFTTAGGLAVNRIAKWNGVNWSALGGGVSKANGNASVSSLTVFADESGPSLCVGGDFPVSPARDGYVARWGCPRRFEHAQAK